MITPMNTLQSWALMVMVLMFVVLVVYLIHALSERNTARRKALEEVPPARLATVTELRPSKPVRHLSLVPDLPAAPSNEPYDWQKQGL